MSDFQHIQKTLKKRLNTLERGLLLLATKEYTVIMLVLFFLSGIFLDTQFLDTFFIQSIKTNKLVAVPFVFPSPASYPVLHSVLGSRTESITRIASVSASLSAQAAIVMDSDSKVVLFSKNPTIRFSMASTTKIMTALVGLSYFKQGDVLTVERSYVEGSVAKFHKGEQIRFVDLLYAMMLPSANDAAYAIADNYPGGEQNFVAEMNKKAKDFHLFQTHYQDPVGLEDDGDYTTVVDLAHLASIAMQNQILAEVVGTKEKVITTVSGNTYILENLNKLLGVQGVNGMKTGFTDEALGVLVTSKKEQDKTLILVVMKSVDRFADTQILLSLISGQVQYESMHL